jgi:hypothetical protein
MERGMGLGSTEIVGDGCWLGMEGVLGLCKEERGGMFITTSSFIRYCNLFSQIEERLGIRQAKYLSWTDD